MHLNRHASAGYYSILVITYVVITQAINVDIMSVFLQIFINSTGTLKSAGSGWLRRVLAIAILSDFWKIQLWEFSTAEARA